MAQNDRTTGLVGNAGCKVPCRLATTAVIVASGLLVVDGVQTVAGDRILRKDETNTILNGVWVVDTGDWSRAKDFDGSYDIVNGSIIRVNEGALSGGGTFVIVGTDPITIGTDAITFSRVPINFMSRTSATTVAGQRLINLGASYQLGSNALAVYVDGLRVREGASADYVETSTSSITFNYDLQAGQQVDAYIGLAVGNLTAAAASAVAITDGGDFFLTTTVEGALQELVDAIEADVGNASSNLTWGSSKPVQRWNTALTANRTAAIQDTNAKEGAHFFIVRGSGATGNFTLAVTWSGGTLATLRAPGEWCRARYDAGTAAWILEAYGILPSAEVLGMSADKGDASANLTVGTDSRTQRWATVLTDDRSADLQSAGAYEGARFRIERLESATGGYALVVTGGAVTICRLAVGQWCDVEYTGTAWLVVAFGNLRQRNSSLIELRDDFVGEEIDNYRWQSLIGTDADCRAAIVLADQSGGVVRLTTGDDVGATMALNGVQLQSQLNWSANKGVFEWEARVALSSIASVVCFIGLTDQRAILEMPFTLGAGDALTSNATDACGVLFDTAADTDNWWGVGVAADIDAAKQNFAVAPVAGALETWRMEISATGSVKFYRNGTLIGAAMASAVTPSVKLTPVVAVFSRTNASKSIDVDVIAVQSQR